MMSPDKHIRTQKVRSPGLATPSERRNTKARVTRMEEVEWSRLPPQLFVYLVADVLRNLEFTDVESQGVGPDGGLDLFCTQHLALGVGEPRRFRWGVQCKFSSHSVRRSVGDHEIRDVEAILRADRFVGQELRGYMLVTNQLITQNVIDRLKGIDRRSFFRTATIDGIQLERLLLLPEQADLRRTYFEAPATSIGGSPLMLLIEGEKAYQQGDLERALDSYRRWLEIKPDDPETFNTFGNVLIDMGRLKDAAAAYRRSLDLRPNNPRTLHNLGNALFDAGELGAAADAYRRSLEIRPGNPRTLHNLGCALFDAGKLREAEEAYRRSLQIRPDEVNTLNSLGIALYMAGRFHEGEDVFERVLHLSDNAEKTEPEVQINRGIALIALSRPDEGKAVFNAMLTLHPMPIGQLRRALGDLRHLANLGIKDALDCISLTEAALAIPTHS